MTAPRFTSDELAAATGGHFIGPAPAAVLGVSTDTRTLPAGSLFVALRGERFDGHDHLAEATARGAAAALVSADWLAALAAGVFGLVAGAMIAKRVWFTNSVPAAKPAPAEHRLPGVQDEFARIRARQGVLAFLLISELIALAAVRFAIQQGYPSLFGIPRNRFLAWVSVLAAVTLALGLANWRCPNCRCNLGRSLSIRQCPRCGIVLRD